MLLRAGGTYHHPEARPTPVETGFHFVGTPRLNAIISKNRRLLENTQLLFFLSGALCLLAAVSLRVAGSSLVLAAIDLLFFPALSWVVLPLTRNGDQASNVTRKRCCLLVSMIFAVYFSQEFYLRYSTVKPGDELWNVLQCLLPLLHLAISIGFIYVISKHFAFMIIWQLARLAFAASAAALLCSNLILAMSAQTTIMQRYLPVGVTSLSSGILWPVFRLSIPVVASPGNAQAFLYHIDSVLPMSALTQADLVVNASIQPPGLVHAEGYVSARGCGSAASASTTSYGYDSEISRTMGRDIASQYLRKSYVSPSVSFGSCSQGSEISPIRDLDSADITELNMAPDSPGSPNSFCLAYQF